MTTQHKVGDILVHGAHMNEKITQRTLMAVKTEKGYRWVMDRFNALATLPDKHFIDSYTVIGNIFDLLCKSKGDADE